MAEPKTIKSLWIGKIIIDFRLHRTSCSNKKCVSVIDIENLLSQFTGFPESFSASVKKTFYNALHKFYDNNLTPINNILHKATPENLYIPLPLKSSAALKIKNLSSFAFC